MISRKQILALLSTCLLAYLVARWGEIWGELLLIEAGIASLIGAITGKIAGYIETCYSPSLLFQLCKLILWLSGVGALLLGIFFTSWYIFQLLLPLHYSPIPPASSGIFMALAFFMFYIIFPVSFILFGATARFSFRRRTNPK